ncbi:MAG TPA: HAD family phosphatase [Steroidobacteraceae bacterium]|nr:HAD family phosphatase [Steroidobacteraceae bacterium]
MRPFDLIIFDLDETLVDFTPARRLELLAQITGLPQDRIHASIWGSDFERLAEQGAYATGDAYLAGFNERLGVELTRDQWIAARRAAMRLRPEMIALVAELKPHFELALLTNNGALLREALPVLVPEVCALIDRRLHASCDFGARKPDPEVFTRLVARYGVAPSRALFIDDHHEFIEGARRAGLGTIHFQSVGQLRAQLRSMDCLPWQGSP